MDINKDTKLTRENGWRQGVNFDLEEMRDLMNWVIRHTCPQSMFTIKQSSSSGIGTNTVIQCSCGEGKDVTNYGAW